MVCIKNVVDIRVVLEFVLLISIFNQRICYHYIYVFIKVIIFLVIFSELFDK